MDPITRKETFLAKAGGQDVTTPTPITREEVFLDEIAKRGGGSSLPSTETASAGDVLSLDDNKEPQWAAPSGSGGGVLVVHEDEDGALDKTWQEIADSDLCILNHFGAKMIQYGRADPISQGKFKVFFWNFYESSQVVYEADTPTDYPVYVEEP